MLTLDALVDFRWAEGKSEATGELLTTVGEFIRAALVCKESGRGMIARGLGCLIVWVSLYFVLPSVMPLSNEYGIVRGDGHLSVL